MTTEAFGVIGYMAAMMKMTNYKLKSADVIVLKNSCERLHNLLVQKADKPGDVDTGELDDITNNIVAGAMILYFGGGIDTILTQKSRKSEPPEANEVTKKKPLFKMEKMKCPFCGSEAVFIGDTATIKCKSCGYAFIVTNPMTSKMEAKEAWNRRADNASIELHNES